jgi:hypothetical protein
MADISITAGYQGRRRPMDGKVAYEIDVKPGGGWQICRPFSERLNSFRAERVHKIGQRETPVVLEVGPTVVLHMVPHASLNESVEVEIKPLRHRSADLLPMGSGGCSYRYNAAGFLTYASASEGRSSSYLQLFRNGVFETVSSQMFRARDGQQYLLSRFFEEEVISAVARLAKAATTIGIMSPCSVSIGLVGAKDARMGVDASRHWFNAGSTFGSDALLVPWVDIGDADADFAAELRPSFDFVWQAAGWPESHYYDASGKRTQ